MFESSGEEFFLLFPVSIYFEIILQFNSSRFISVLDPKCDKYLSLKGFGQHFDPIF